MNINNMQIDQQINFKTQKDSTVYKMIYSFFKENIENLVEFCSSEYYEKMCSHQYFNIHEDYQKKCGYNDIHFIGLRTRSSVKSFNDVLKLVKNNSTKNQCSRKLLNYITRITFNEINFLFETIARINYDKQDIEKTFELKSFILKRITINDDNESHNCGRSVSTLIFEKNNIEKK